MDDRRIPVRVEVSSLIKCIISLQTNRGKPWLHVLLSEYQSFRQIFRHLVSFPIFCRPSRAIPTGASPLAFRSDVLVGTTWVVACHVGVSTGVYCWLCWSDQGSIEEADRKKKHTEITFSPSWFTLELPAIANTPWILGLLSSHSWFTH